MIISKVWQLSSVHDRLTSVKIAVKSREKIALSKNQYKSSKTIIIIYLYGKQLLLLNKNTRDALYNKNGFVVSTTFK